MIMIQVVCYTHNLRYPVGYIVCKLLSIASEKIYSHKLAHDVIVVENMKTSRNSWTCFAHIVVPWIPYGFQANKVKYGRLKFGWVGAAE